MHYLKYGVTDYRIIIKKKEIIQCTEKHAKEKLVCSKIQNYTKQKQNFFSTFRYFMRALFTMYNCIAFVVQKYATKNTYQSKCKKKTPKGKNPEKNLSIRYFYLAKPNRKVQSHVKKLFTKVSSRISGYFYCSSKSQRFNKTYFQDSGIQKKKLLERMLDST